MISGQSFPGLLLSLLSLLAAAGSAVAGEPSRPAQSPTTPEVRSYCQNIAGAAADARFAWQTKTLEAFDAKVTAKVADLDAKTAELKSWIGKRQEIERKAGEKLVGIYAKMRPETAASQIATLDDTMAAAVLGQLTPGKASAIFNEIVPERAAKLAALIAGINPPPAPDEKKL